MNRRIAITAALALATLSWGGVSGAQDGDSLALGPDSDPLELARRVARVGDIEVLAAIGGAAPDRSMLAIQAAPYLAAPEAALPVLAAVASGRDPDLAPAAALAAQQVVAGLSAQDLMAREVSAEDVEAGAELFAAAAANEDVRSDIRQAALLVVAGLGAVLAP